MPNDTFLLGGKGIILDSQTAESLSERPSKQPNMLLLTGPNFSGKSVYLKQVRYISHTSSCYDTEQDTQVALIVYLAHIGRYNAILATSSSH